LGAAQLNHLLAELESALSRSSSSREAGQRVASALLDPLLPHLEGSTRLLIVPDGALWSVPWSALPLTDERWFGDRWIHSTSPSLAVLGELEGRASATAGGPLRPGAALILADPDRSLATTEPRRALPGARSEGEALAALLPRATLLLGAQARKEALRRLAPELELLHIGAHAVAVEPASELHSRILLAADSNEPSGELRATEIAQLDFQRSPVVVLGACSTAKGDPETLEGRLDLAQPFLAAGARAVLGTRWDIPDATAPHFFKAFYAAYGKYADGPRALREAQRAMRQSPAKTLAQPVSWAGYEWIGAR
jgi:CHAT domain-containing protein